VIRSDPTNTDVVNGPEAYSPFGEMGDHTGPDRLGYRGELTSSDLINLRNRNYDPVSGQFTSQDPLDGVNGAPGVANPYQYGDNDPLVRIDPLGLRVKDNESLGEVPPGVGGVINIMPRPGLGQVQINAFIAACESGYQFNVGLVYVSEKYTGNCRQFDPAARGNESKVSMRVDFEIGKVYVYVNHSCRVGGGCHDALPLGINAPDLPSVECGTQPAGTTTTSTAPHVQPDCTPVDQKFPNRVNVVDTPNELRLQYGVVNSATSKWLPTPKINGTVTLVPRSSQDIQACFDGDNYPSMEIYQEARGESLMIAQWNESPVGPLSLSPPAPNRQKCGP
jgi:RHS repeat-associated protein